MVTSIHKAEKITVTIPSALKEQLQALKQELQTSMSAIYKEALQSYLEQKEREKWARAADRMAKVYEEDEVLRDWVEFEEGFHDDPSS